MKRTRHAFVGLGMPLALDHIPLAKPNLVKKRFHWVIYLPYLCQLLWTDETEKMGEMRTTTVMTR